jgi:acyl-CoA thioesterase-2
MWFHRPITMNDWVLYDTESPSASGARGLGTGHFFGADGRMLATVVQEGLVRLR